MYKKQARITSQVKYSHSCEVIGSAVKHSNLKLSM